MRDIDLSELLALAGKLQTPPYDVQITRKLCEGAESILTEIFYREPYWSEHHYCLDGFVHTQIDKSGESLIISGGMWLISSAIEPCQIEISSLESENPRIVLRFGDAAGTPIARLPERLKFPFEDWLYIFELDPGLPIPPESA